MGWFKNLFNKVDPVAMESGSKSATAIPRWNPADEDFITQNVDQCLDLMLKERLLDVYDIVPNQAINSVFVAGGFASHLAGITQSHRDIDLFCVSPSTYDIVGRFIQERNAARPRFFAIGGYTHIQGPEKGLPYLAESTGWDGGRVCKFIYKDQQYDLVDISHKFDDIVTLSPITTLLKLFDFNWTMSAVNLTQQTITCHKTSLFDKPLINAEYSHEFYGVALERLERYRSRLTKDVDKEAADKLANYLKHVIKQRGVCATDWY